MSKWKITLQETTKGRHFMERTKRWQVMLNGKPWGDPFYFNMRGFVGTLPTPSGGKFSPPEVSLTSLRAIVADLNREAANAHAGAHQ
jgi:hypothetical protein